MIAFTLPTPPSLNNAYVNAPGKGRVKSREYNLWSRLAVPKIKAARKGWRIDGPAKVEICLAAKTRGDVDNRIKATLDALVCAGLLRDDAQVWDVRAYRQEGGDPRECGVSVWEMGV